MNTDLAKLSDKELVLLWERGCNWLRKYMTRENKEAVFLQALDRIETIENELKRRGVEYGST